MPSNPVIKPIVGRFNVPVWEKYLRTYRHATYILDGIQNGFRIGIDAAILNKNKPITRDPVYIKLDFYEKQAITDWLLKGVSKGFIAGPFDLNYQFPWPRGLHCAPMFVVPKPGFRNYRPIVHLSWKQFGHYLSVNELLCDYMKTVNYVSFKETVNLINNAGKGAYIFLIDAQDAYYRVPIHPSDFCWNGLKWAKKYWVFLSLQMGLSSSPKIYTAFADAIEYICVNNNKDIAFLNGIQQLRHYIDDFFACVRSKKKAWRLYKALFNLMTELGIPTQEKKCTPPNTRAKVLGWIYDTLLQCVELPPKKRLDLIKIIERLLKTQRSDKKSLEQLIGKLQNASKVVFPGKAFVRRLEAVLYLPGWQYDVPLNLSDFVCEDLVWWLEILKDPKCTRTSFDLLLKLPSDGDFYIYTDAASEVGVGGHTQGHAFRIEWKDTILSEITNNARFDIELLECLGSLIATILWSGLFHGSSVTIYNDNPGAASAIRTKAPRLYRIDMQYLIRTLSMCAVANKFYFWGLHCTRDNDPKMDLADGLSRVKLNEKYSFESNNWINDSKQAILICNNLIRNIANLPANLPKNRDIDSTIRQEFNILLNDDLLKSQLIKLNDNTLNAQLNYNILTN